MIDLQPGLKVKKKKGSGKGVRLIFLFSQDNCENRKISLTPFPDPFF